MTVVMSQLTDAKIREALKARLRSLTVPPRAILEEVRVHNGNAVADVVAVHRAAHCYEIKGETDTLNRLVRQASFYDLAFRRITVVTTENHLAQVRALAPNYWGVVLATMNDRAPKLRYWRKASDSPLFDKRVALLTLWKRELLDMCLVPNMRLEKMSRHALTTLISESDTVPNVSERIAEALVNRQTASGWSIAM